MFHKKQIFKDSYWMAGSTGLRLASGLLLFVVLAREMQIEQFGLLMTWFAIAALCAIPANFGLALFLLREGSRAEDRGTLLLNQIIGLKIFIIGVTSTAILMASFALPINTWLLWPLLFTHTAEAFTELFCAQLRILGHYNLETKFVTKQAVFQLIIVGAFGLTNSSPTFVALGFLLSRLVTIVFATQAIRNVTGAIPIPSFMHIGLIAKRASAYFADFGVQSTLVQIDVVLLSYFSGSASVAIYQAGMKIVQGLSQLITIIVNVILPRLSRNLINRPLGWKETGQVTALFLVAGLTLSTPMYLGSKLISSLLYGAKFPSLPPVLELLALFLLIRFIGAAAGILLIASGEQKLRATIMSIALLVLYLAGSYFMPAYGAQGAALAMSITYAFIAISLSFIVILRVRFTHNTPQLIRDIK
jgi:O-antigen/teichoic acid export membrane protein